MNDYEDLELYFILKELMQFLLTVRSSILASLVMIQLPEYDSGHFFAYRYVFIMTAVFMSCLDNFSC